MRYASDNAGALNLYFCTRHTRIALERMETGGRNVQGHLRHVVLRLEREVRAFNNSLGSHWYQRLRREDEHDAIMGPINIYRCAGYACVALQRFDTGGSNVLSPLRKCLFRLERELVQIEKQLGPRWRKRLHRGKYS